MKDTIKFALSSFGLYLLVMLISSFFFGALLSENLMFRILSTTLLLVILAGMGFFEGGSRGEADAALKRRLEKRREDRGETPTQEETSRCYRPFKGVAAGLLSTSPLWLLALYLILAPLVGLPNPPVLITIMRIALFPFIGVFGDLPLDITWYYLPMTLLYPAAIAVGYYMGPRRFAKMLRLMHDSGEKRRKKRNKNRRPMPR